MVSKNRRYWKRSPCQKALARRRLGPPVPSFLPPMSRAVEPVLQRRNGRLNVGSGHSVGDADRMCYHCAHLRVQTQGSRGFSGAKPRRPRRGRNFPRGESRPTFRAESGSNRSVTPWWGRGGRATCIAASRGSLRERTRRLSLALRTYPQVYPCALWTHS
jgi:hypothetical protein